MEFCAQPSRNDTEVFAAPLRSKFLAYAAYGIRIGLETTLDVIPYLSSPLIPGAELDASEPAGCPFPFSTRAIGEWRFNFSGFRRELRGVLVRQHRGFCPGTVGRSGTDGDAGRAGTGYPAYFGARGGSPACARGAFGFLVPSMLLYWRLHLPWPSAWAPSSEWCDGQCGKASRSRALATAIHAKLTAANAAGDRGDARNEYRLLLRCIRRALSRAANRWVFRLKVSRGHASSRWRIAMM